MHCVAGEELLVFAQSFFPQEREREKYLYTIIVERGRDPLAGLENGFQALKKTELSGKSREVKRGQGAIARLES